MIFEYDDGIINTPGGWLALAPGVLGVVDLCELRERWLRTRMDHLIEAVERASSHRVFPRGEVFEGVAHALADFAGTAGDAQANRFAVWELTNGHVRRGEVAFDTSSASHQNGSCLRARALRSIELPRAVLTNHVVAYLGRPLNQEIGWLTAAPSVGSTRNWNGKEVRTLSWSGHQSSYGMSEIAALLEGIERRVGALEGAPRTTVAAAKDLEGRVITPEDFPAYPASFYREIGRRFDPADPHEWVVVENLTREEAWIPREYVYYGEQIDHHLWALGTSSGCATGSTIDEARLFGLLELIERDSFVLSWYASINASPIDFCDISSIRPLLARAELLGISISCGVIPSIIGIPVVVSSATMEVDGPVVAVGSACHPSVEWAISGAINEVWTYIHERAQLASRHADRVVELKRNPRAVDGIEEHPLLGIYPDNPVYLHLTGQGQPAPVVENEWWALTVGSASDVLAAVVSALAAKDIEVWFHTQTSSLEREIGLETVMAISPQLIPIDFGWELQRVLQSPRLAYLLKKYHGSGAHPRIVPHPFS